VSPSGPGICNIRTNPLKMEVQRFVSKYDGIEKADRNTILS
jgi:hypothetical protein